MARSAFPRARGGRGPQIGPGTFLGRTSITDDRPPVFSHLVWSPGAATPDVEMWCFLQLDLPPAEKYVMLNPVSPALHYAWLEQVPEPAGFQPPAQQPTLGNETEFAFKDYAVQRMLSSHNVLTSPADWVVRVARPYAYPTAAASKLRFGAKILRVRQADRGDDPVAWVWISMDGAREIWFMHRPGTPDGFAFVGRALPGTEQPYTSTRLWYSHESGITYSAGPITNAFLESLKSDIKTASGGVVIDVDDLEVHDYRIGPDT